MGKLLYGDAQLEIQFEDRALAHLQIVIGTKLRRRESFFLNWRDDASVGDGRSSVWLDPAIPLYFKFFGGRTPEINREWLELLTQSSNSTAGLQLLDEPKGSSGAARPTSSANGSGGRADLAR